MTKEIEVYEDTASQRYIYILNTHPFAKTEDKTQIIRPKSNTSFIFRTRQTHSIEVAALAENISRAIKFKYINQLKNVCLLHDIGHPPFGHSGQKLLDKKIKEYGLKEGFDDNNGNIQIIKNNNIKVSPYELVSLVKYPSKLYKGQKKEILPLLERYLKIEEKEWGKKQRTMACIIMDTADEISYSLSDFIDGYILGYAKDKVVGFLNDIIEIAEDKKTKKLLSRILKNLLTYKSKNRLREDVTNLKNHLSSTAFYLKGEESIFLSSNNGEIVEEFIKFNLYNFIRHEEVKSQITSDLESFEKYIDYVLGNRTFISNLYGRIYNKKRKTKKRILRVLRDMIADTTDNYVINFVEQNKL